MLRKSILLVLALTFSSLIGCASVPMADAQASLQAKTFDPPSEGTAGLYIYRGGGVGTALKKSIWVDDKCIGQSAPRMFFYEEVAGDEEHKISTESEFSPNDIFVETERGRNYFVKQSIKMGVFVGGAKLTVMDEDRGKREVSELEMATKGDCGG